MLLAPVAGAAVLACFGASGVAFLRRFSSALDPVERLVYGIPLGWVLASLAILVVACFVGLHVWLVVAVSAIGAVSLFFQGRERHDSERKRGQSLFAAIVLGILVLRWLLFWSGAFTVDAEGLWTSQDSLWGDAAQHLGDTTSFAYGDKIGRASCRERV